TYRKMAEDTVDRAAVVAGLERKDCPTKNLRIHGWLKNVDRNSHLFVYGSDIVNIRELIEEHPTWEERLHPDYPYMKAEVIWAVPTYTFSTVRCQDQQRRCPDGRKTVSRRAE